MGRWIIATPDVGRWVHTGPQRSIDKIREKPGLCPNNTAVTTVCEFEQLRKVIA